MKKFLMSILCVSLVGCAHTDWVVPAAAGLAVGAAVVNHSRPVTPRPHYYQYHYYPQPQRYIVPPPPKQYYWNYRCNCYIAH